MGTTQRPDIWGAEKMKQEATPGPGNFGETYSSFKTGKGRSFGAKQNKKVDSTPGPGQYSSPEVYKKTGQIKIGTSGKSRDPFGA